MDITINLVAPELSAAINNLAVALLGNSVKPEVTEKISKKQPKATLSEIKPTVEPEILEEINEDTSESPLDEVTYTLEEVRATLTALSQAGKSKEMRQLINSFGVSKLTDIPADKYPEVMEKAAKLK